MPMRPYMATSADATTTTHESGSIAAEVRMFRPYLRDAAITCLPCLRDDQLRRIEAEVLITHPHVIASRLTDYTVFVQGIAIEADSPIDADKHTWERMYARVHAALRQPNDGNTRIASIDVRSASGLV